eukprot:scaffold5.g694.t1
MSGLASCVRALPPTTARSRPRLAPPRCHTGSNEAVHHETTRRQLLLSAPIAAALLAAPARAPPPAIASEAPAAGAASADLVPASLYTDEQDKFSIAIPKGWASGTGDFGQASLPESGPQSSRFSNNAGLQRLVAWYVPSNSDVSVAVTITPSSYEFVRLGSLGRAEIAKLLDARESKGRYLIDYTLQKEGQEPRTVLTAVAIGNNGRQQRFYTVNASCPASLLPAYEATLRSVVKSFVAPPPLS